MIPDDPAIKKLLAPWKYIWTVQSIYFVPPWTMYGLPIRKTYSYPLRVFFYIINNYI